MSCGMGFVENHPMQSKSTNVVSSRVQSDGFVLEMEKPKYKRRRVLGVRTFPPGCGPNAVPIPANSVTESHGLAVSSGGETGDPVALENGSDGLKQDMDSVALEKDVLEQTDHDQFKVDSMPNGEGVPNDVMIEIRSNACGDDSLEQMDRVKPNADDELPSEELESENNLGVDSPAESSSMNNAEELTDPDKEAVVQKYPPRRKISGVRDFPPSCGRNAKPPSKVEVQEDTETAKAIDTDAGTQQGKVLARKSSLVKRKVARKSVIMPRDSKKSFSLGKNQMDEKNRDDPQFVQRPTDENGGSTSSDAERSKVEGQEDAETGKDIDTDGGAQSGSEVLKEKVLVRKSSSVKRVAKKSVIMPLDSKKSFYLGKKLSQRAVDENGDDPQFLRRPTDTNGGSTSSNAERSKVQEVLRLFHSLCKVFEEEAKTNPGKRVDFLAAAELKSRGKHLNAGQHIIGSVPGVEVGDEFQYRLELHIIGLHRPTQGGIDFIKQPRGIVAMSVVASGGYDDNLDNSDVLEYTGQGGVSTKGKQPEDQKLERGNLSLANSVTVKNPVRVVRGRNRMMDDGKVGKLYVYDGLYTVEEYWQETGPQGKQVFKFRLVRISGQPEVAWKQSKNSKKTPTGRSILHD